MAQTERRRYVFTVKEFGDGKPWIALEASADSLSCLENGLLGLDLRPGTDYTTAVEIASLLNGSIVGVAYTRFGPEDS